MAKALHAPDGGQEALVLLGRYHRRTRDRDILRKIAAKSQPEGKKVHTLPRCASAEKCRKPSAIHTCGKCTEPLLEDLLQLRAQHCCITRGLAQAVDVEGRDRCCEASAIIIYAEDATIETNGLL
jgi:hypothetical protein